jgi:uncharacterized protein
MASSENTGRTDAGKADPDGEAFATTRWHGFSTALDSSFDFKSSCVICDRIWKKALMANQDEFRLASDIVTASRNRGNLATLFYLIHTKPAGPLELIFAHLEEHLEYHEKLTEEGKVYRAGPLWTEDGVRWAGEGLILVRVESYEEALKIAEEDILHSSGARTYTITPWLINHAPGNRL